MDVVCKKDTSESSFAFRRLGQVTGQATGPWVTGLVQSAHVLLPDLLIYETQLPTYENLGNSNLTQRLEGAVS